MFIMRTCEYRPNNGEVVRDCIFEAWGYDSMETSGEDINMIWSIAIISLPDGSVVKAMPEQIKFTDIKTRY